MTHVEPMIYFFQPGSAEGDPALKHVLGGKGASLAALSRAGLPVPPGFTISIPCCTFYLTHDRRWPANLEEELHKAVRRLESVTGRFFGRGPQPLLVSVRSGAAHSMPGMMDTILNCGLVGEMADGLDKPARFWSVYARFIRQFGVTVGRIPEADFDDAAKDLPCDLPEKTLARRFMHLYQSQTGRTFPGAAMESLHQCVNAVFESWNNERAVVYRKVHGLGRLEGTAVNVQAMFDSEVSGVVFTANPARPLLREMVIESSYGLGESVVSGEVTPDRFVLDRDTLTIKEKVLGNKVRVMRAWSSDDTNVPDPGRFSLSDSQVRELARISLDVSRHFGHEVDVEWGLSNGRFALLQSRAVRGLDVARDVEVGRQEEIGRLRSLAEKRPKVWVMHNLAETLRMPTPLTWDITASFMKGDGGFGRMYRDLGYRPGREVMQRGFLELICGRIYTDPDLAAELFWEGLPFKYDHNDVLADPRVLETAPVKFDAQRTDEKLLLRLPGAVLAMLRSSRVLRKARASALERFEQEVLPPFMEYVMGKRELVPGSLSTTDLLTELDERLRVVLRDFGSESLKPGFFGGCARAQLQAVLVQLLGPREGETLTQALTSGLDNDSTVAQNALLYDVARGDCEFKVFLDMYGHRAVNEMELAVPRWREDTSYLLQLIRTAPTSPDHSPSALHRRNEERRKRAMLELGRTLSGVGGSFLEERVRSLAREAQALLPYREIGKHYLMMGYEIIRSVLLELARRWDLDDDVFCLRLDELSRFETDRERLTGEIARRKVRHQSARRLDPPPVIDSRHLDHLGLPRPLAATRELTGVPLSAGVVSGTVRIVHDPVQTGTLPDDCILVCQSTDPGWTTLFTRITGLVVERGGVLSHGAITARDFSIPAVTCPDATRILQDGQRVRVDGDSGQVSILREESHA